MLMRNMWKCWSVGKPYDKHKHSWEQKPFPSNYARLVILELTKTLSVLRKVTDHCKLDWSFNFNEPTIYLTKHPSLSHWALPISGKIFEQVIWCCSLNFHVESFSQSVKLYFLPWFVGDSLKKSSGIATKYTFWWSANIGRRSKPHNSMSFNNIFSGLPVL